MTIIGCGQISPALNSPLSVLLPLALPLWTIPVKFSFIHETLNLMNFHSQFTNTMDYLQPIFHLMFCLCNVKFNTQGDFGPLLPGRPYLETKKMRPAGIPKSSGIWPRQIFVFLWVFHKLGFRPLQVLERVSPLRSTFLH